jgi:hypothetical protein
MGHGFQAFSEVGLAFIFCAKFRAVVKFLYIYNLSQIQWIFENKSSKIDLKKKSLEIVTFLYMGSKLGYPKLCNDVFFFFPFHILLIGKSN